MNLDRWLQLASEGANVLQAFVWLFVALGVFAYFRAPVRQFLQQAAELTITLGPGGIKANMKRQLIEASATLAAAEVAKQAGISATSELTSRQVENIVNIVDSTVTPQRAKRLSDARILWVDDRPENNTYERQAFVSLGMRIDLARSTNEALAKIHDSRTYDVIISDMGRPPDQEAGYTLLRALREKNIQTSFVIYAGSNLPEHKRRAQSEGAQGSTNNPVELFELVIQAVKGA